LGDAQGILAEVVEMAGYQRPLIAVMVIALIPTAIEAGIDQEIRAYPQFCVRGIS
jgi:hypothetical protein